eukprot:1158603-Pelagomonas_calceolata.AAC.2
MFITGTFGGHTAGAGEMDEGPYELRKDSWGWEKASDIITMPSGLSKRNLWYKGTCQPGDHTATATDNSTLCLLKLWTWRPHNDCDGQLHILPTETVNLEITQRLRWTTPHSAY